VYSILHAQETIDGDLASRVFGILAVADEGLHLQRCAPECFADQTPGWKREWVAS